MGKWYIFQLSRTVKSSLDVNDFPADYVGVLLFGTRVSKSGQRCMSFLNNNNHRKW